MTDNGSGNSATYSYLANSPWVGQIAFANGGQTRMTTTKQYDYLNRLTSISSMPSAAAVVSFAYQYNSANQRTAATSTDGSYWTYGYDPLGQVTSGAKRWGDNSLVAGDQFQYAFDTIGNRTVTATGGDQNGNNLRSATYSANNLNQYTSRTVPGYAEITGSAASNASVTIGTGPTACLAPYRKTNYFWGELAVANSSSAAWLGITNVGVVANGTNRATASLSSGGLFVLQTPEQFRYDGDGNLTNDGRWSYFWDAENRLAKMAANTSVGPQISLVFGYDWQGRRIQKQVWPDASCSGTPTNNATFLYDGWSLIATLNATNNLRIQSYIWGLDLSGSPPPQEDTTAGGLLGLVDAVHGAQFASYDGNGNVTALIAVGGTISAQYEYGPSGEVICSTGLLAALKPFRFSTKYHDGETDLLYCGYRYYNPSTGDWLSRAQTDDPGFAALRDSDASSEDVAGIDAADLDDSAEDAEFDAGDTAEMAFVNNDLINDWIILEAASGGRSVGSGASTSTAAKGKKPPKGKNVKITFYCNVTVRRSRLTLRCGGVAGWQGETTIISIPDATTPPQRQSES